MCTFVGNEEQVREIMEVLRNTEKSLDELVGFDNEEHMETYRMLDKVYKEMRVA